MAKIDESKLITFVVCEGEAYRLDKIPANVEAFCNQDTWLCDWLFVGAYSPVEAVKVAEVVDEACSKRSGRIYTKYIPMNDARSTMLKDHALTPQQILSTAKNESNFIFRQGWVTV